jgi:hypothetical protein
MDSRLIALALVVLTIAFVFGYARSQSSGIQAGYFEKAEAPAYGVGGDEGIGVEMDKEIEKHFKQLTLDEEE